MDIKKYIKSSIETKNKIIDNNEIIKTVQVVSDKIVKAYQNGNKVITAGNGGSASDAQHIAGELVSKMLLERKGLCAHSLTVNSSVATAISNDYGYKKVFSRQLEAYSKEGDIFIAISTSGNSENIIDALQISKDLGIITVGLTGLRPCKMDDLCDFIIKVPSNETPIIQEAHIMLGHIICAIVEEKLFNQDIVK